jgi:hypothetical protein
MAKAKNNSNLLNWLVVSLLVSNLVLIYISALLWNQIHNDNEQNALNIYKNAAQTSKLEACYNQGIKPCN